MRWAARPDDLLPLAFLILARLFWNQILIWDSLRPRSRARSWRLFSVRYLFSSNSFLRRASCSEVKAVRGRFSSGLRSRRLMRRERGPGGERGA